MRKPSVLFLCTGNSARSQMAEALLRKRGGDRFESYSAGMSPKGIHPLTRKALAEVGIDMAGQRSKDVAEYLGTLWAHFLIVVCDRANQTCPRVWPGVIERLFWDLDDPAAAQGTEEQQLAVFRRVRDEIDTRVQAFIHDVEVSGKLDSAEAGQVR